MARFVKAETGGNEISRDLQNGFFSSVPQIIVHPILILFKNLLQAIKTKKQKNLLKFSFPNAGFKNLLISLA